MQNIKLAFRSLSRDKIFSIVNIAGLTLALVVSLVIGLFVRYQYSFDKNIANRDRSYRIITGLDENSLWASTFAAFDKILADQPMVEASTVFYKNDEDFDIESEGRKFRISNPVYADTCFMSYFHIPLNMGNPADLENPNAVFISQPAAVFLFGDENPVGKSANITYNNGRTTENRKVIIAGVLSDKMPNSHLKYDLIHSKAGFYQNTISIIEQRKVYGAYVYLTLVPGASPLEFESRINEMLTPVLGNVFGPPLEAFISKLQPVSDIHSTPGLVRDISPTIKRSQLKILLLVSFLLFATVALNFLIMNMSRSEIRLHKTRVLQFLGGTSLSIYINFLVEVLLLAVPAIFLTVIIIYSINHSIINQIFNGWMVELWSPYFWLILVVMGLIIVLSASLVSTSNRLKKKSYQGQPKAIPLIVFQFVVVIAVTGFGLLLNKQINYIHTTDLGYSPENVMIFRAPQGSTTNICVFKEKAAMVPGVISTGTAQHYPGFRLQDNNLGTAENSYPVKFAMVDQDAMKVLGIHVLDTFSVNSGTNFFINETFYHTLTQNYSQTDIENGNFGEEDKDASKTTFHVNGVIKDFNYASLYSTIGNFVFFVNNDRESNYRFLLVRYNQQNTERVKRELKSIAASVYNTEIDPLFLDEQLNLEYQSEEQLLSVTRLFILFTILIAAMGLFAFSLYTIRQRTKEIGIRKVNGAKVTEILTMLNAEFLKWVIVSIIIATPLAWYAVDQWLQSFAYKTVISWWIFALSGIIALGIALLTVSWQSWKAATRNPVEALRFE